MGIYLLRTFCGRYARRREYYDSFITKGNLESTVQCLTREYPGIFTTSQEINFNDFRWGGSEKELVRKLGSPRYRVEELNDLAGHSLLFYKTEISGQKAVMQCHLLGDELYFIHLDVLSLPRDSEIIRDTIHKKYNIRDFDWGTNIYLIDHSQNRLILEHDVHLNISYISGNFSILQKFQELLSLHDHSKQIMLSEKQIDLFKLL